MRKRNNQLVYSFYFIMYDYYTNPKVKYRVNIILTSTFLLAMVWKE